MDFESMFDSLRERRYYVTLSLIVIIFPFFFFSFEKKNQLSPTYCVDWIEKYHKCSPNWWAGFKNGGKISFEDLYMCIPRSSSDKFNLNSVTGSIWL